MQHRRRPGERALEATGEGAAQHEFARYAVVHPFDEHVGYAGIGCPRDKRRIGRQQRGDQHEREARKLLGPGNEALRVFTGAGIDDHDIDELLDEIRLDVGGTFGGVYMRATPWEGRAHQHPRALTLEERDHTHGRCGTIGAAADRGHQRDGAVCTPARGVGAWAGSPAGSPPRTMALARINTSRALAYETSFVASSNVAHRQAVIPSARCGVVLEASLRMR